MTATLFLNSDPYPNLTPLSSPPHHPRSRDEIKIVQERCGTLSPIRRIAPNPLPSQLQAPYTLLTQPSTNCALLNHQRCPHRKCYPITSKNRSSSLARITHPNSVMVNP